MTDEFRVRSLAEIMAEKKGQTPEVFAVPLIQTPPVAPVQAPVTPVVPPPVKRIDRALEPAQIAPVMKMDLATILKQKLEKEKEEAAKRQQAETAAVTSSVISPGLPKTQIKETIRINPPQSLKRASEDLQEPPLKRVAPAESHLVPVTEPTRLPPPVRRTNPRPSVRPNNTFSQIPSMVQKVTPATPATAASTPSSAPQPSAISVPQLKKPTLDRFGVGTQQQGAGSRLPQAATTHVRPTVRPPNPRVAVRPPRAPVRPTATSTATSITTATSSVTSSFATTSASVNSLSVTEVTSRAEREMASFEAEFGALLKGCSAPPAAPESLDTFITEMQDFLLRNGPADQVRAILAKC